LVAIRKLEPKGKSTRPDTRPTPVLHASNSRSTGGRLKPFEHLGHVISSNSFCSRSGQRHGRRMENKRVDDGTLAIFTATDRTHACSAALSAAIVARELEEGKPITDMYLGLHVGEVFYGNIGSRERLDFTVIGPAVNETSRMPRCAVRSINLH